MTAAVRLPRAGELVHIGPRASVQFDGDRGFLMRVIRPHAWSTLTGWTWLDGYQLDHQGNAVERRSVFVRVAGIRRIPVQRRP